MSWYTRWYRDEDVVTCRHCDQPTLKAYAGSNRAGDGWIGECCREEYQELIAEETESEK